MGPRATLFFLFRDANVCERRVKSQRSVAAVYKKYPSPAAHPPAIASNCSYQASVPPIKPPYSSKQAPSNQTFPPYISGVKAKVCQPRRMQRSPPCLPTHPHPPQP